MHVARSTKHPANPPTTQQGAVLIVSLLILLVLTLVGINSMDGSIMEQKMATNSRDSAATFQEAESAIRNTFFSQRSNAVAAVGLARNNIGDDEANVLARTINYRNNSGMTSQTVTTYIGEVPLINSSAGQFIAHGTEVAGIASKTNQGIRSLTVQGYLTAPMPIINPSSSNSLPAQEGDPS